MQNIRHFTVKPFKVFSTNMTNTRRDSLTKVKTEGNICSVSQSYNLLLLSLEWANFSFWETTQCVFTDPRVL